MLGMARTERVFDGNGHRSDSTPALASILASAILLAYIAVRIQRGGGKWPYEAPATIRTT